METTEAKKTKKTILREHRVALDRKIGMIRRGAKSALKNQIAELEAKEYGRLENADVTSNIEELYHDIELKIKEGTEALTKNAPLRIEQEIQTLRRENLISCQEAMNAVEHQYENVVAKTDRVTLPTETA